MADLTGSPVSPTEAGDVAAGAFVPDVETIQRLANAVFHGLTGGAPLASPAVPASPPAPWSAPAQPDAAQVGRALPAQPPFGEVDVPTGGVPSAAPYRSFAGASAGSAAPHGFAQTRAVAPAASQTTLSAPRIARSQALDRPAAGQGDDPQTYAQAGFAPGAEAPVGISPFAAPLDLARPLAALAAAMGLESPATPAPAVFPGFAPETARAGLPATGSPAGLTGPGSLTGADVATPSSRNPAPPPSSSSLTPPAPVSADSAPGIERPAGLDGAPTSPQARYDAGEFSPFSTAPTYGAAQRDFGGFAYPGTEAFPLTGDAVPAKAKAPGVPAPAEAGVPAAANAGAPSLPIAPVFTGASSGTRLFDAATIRNDFPILQERVHGKRLIWLDNGATTQKPQAVIDRLAAFYAHENSNVHRGAHTLAARSTDAYEGARDKVRRFLNAASPKEIVFVRGTTEGVNLVAQAWGRRNVKAGDEIVVTWLEHHANIVPWQQLCAEVGARLRVAPVDDRGDVILDEYEKLLGPKTRIVALTQVANALGTVTPAREMIAAAHRHGALALVDGAQSVSHMPTDVQALDADFFVLSGHKMFAPTGIGVVYGKEDILDRTPPWQGGGNMIADVTFERTLYQSAPERFEAGTGNIADAVGLGAAVDYLETIGMEAIARHEHGLIHAAVAGLRAIPGVRIIGEPRERAGVVSFVVDGCRTEDVGKALDREGIAVRAGHHCAQPILRRFGLESTVRPSFALYNTEEDVEALLAAVRRIALQAQGGSR